MRPLKDKKIIIYKGSSSGPDPNSTVYKPIHSGKLWAYVRQTDGTERYIANAKEVEEEILFVINWRSDLTASSSKGHYVCHNGSWYNIVRVDTYEGYKDNIKLYCKSMPAPPDAWVREYE